jgi:N-acetylglucosaminyldiphosphoundecaprenol N-acetyl-beta-D-mannosaminyltransferase
MPKQEIWMARNQASVNAPVLLGVGAAFDFHAGRKPRAPEWMQRWGLEWAHRLAQEPRRLGGRYVLGNARFVSLAARETARGRLRRLRSAS